MNRQDANREMQEMFGFVPGFMQNVPDEHIGALWENFRKTQLDEGVIPAKYQQLIMLAVSTYAKCKYCTDFHTEVAKALGASQKEITETALLVGNTAMWSNFLGGTQYDFEKFKGEVRNACRHMTSSSKDTQPPKGNGNRARV
ncbi:MAG: carboxymuconolactone decarboxylase family protein [Polyangiaceae bacterium]|nr:carboxymuconolactone decarboxylase family protein [Polyangiaceae bacterium]